MTDRALLDCINFSHSSGIGCIRPQAIYRFRGKSDNAALVQDGSRRANPAALRLIQLVCVGLCFYGHQRLRGSLMLHVLIAITQNTLRVVNDEIAEPVQRMI